MNTLRQCWIKSLAVDKALASMRSMPMRVAALTCSLLVTSSKSED